jgi:hypothetical protein
MAHDVSCSERGTASQPGRQTDQDATLLQERALPPCFRPSLKDQTLGLRCGVGVGGLLKLDHPATATLGRLVPLPILINSRDTTCPAVNAGPPLSPDADS